MGRYSKDEQTIIKKIIELGKNTSCANEMLFSVYMPILDYNQVNVDDKGLYFDATHTQETIMEIENNIASISLLIDDLIKNRLIKLVKVGANLPFLYMVNKGTIYDKIDSNIFYILKQSFYSKVYISAELKELVSNDFKTYEDIQLEEARKQTESASASLAEARKQTGKAKTQTYLSIIAVVLSVIAIIVSFFVPGCTSSKLDQKQFDTIQMKQNELIKTLNEIKISQIDNDSLIKNLNELKISQIDNDSLIKELNLLNQSIDEISNTLNEIKESKLKRK